MAVVYLTLASSTLNQFLGLQSDSIPKNIKISYRKYKEILAYRVDLFSSSHSVILIQSSIFNKKHMDTK